MPMHIDTYLDRIRYFASRKPTLDTLHALQKAHLHNVPFENLDIPLGRPIVLTLQSQYQKVVQEERGGFCYELNGLFCWLLRELGFNVSMLSARVHNGTRFGKPFDHMLLCVTLGEQDWITDVGFGNSFREPLLLNAEPQTQFSGAYQLLPEYDGYTLYQARQESEPKIQYTFSLEPRELAEFEEMCHYQQTSPDSGFTSRQICTIATESGRVSLSNGRLITTDLINNSKTETPITTETELRRLLLQHFGIQFPFLVPLTKLLNPS